MCAVHGGDAPCRCGYAVGQRAGMSLVAALFVVSCVPEAEPCSPSDLSLTIDEAHCLAQVKARCTGIPLDEPCPFEEDCKARTRERCK
jgi:hypothetical protein